MIDDAQVTHESFAISPYHVERFPIGAAVMNRNGFNCLSFRSKPGAKFCSPEAAQAIADKWNKEAGA